MRKELLELRQDPRLFGIVILAPILQLTILGYAATTDVKDVPVVVVDADRSAASRELISRFDASDNFTIVGVVGSTDEIDAWLESGRAWMALSIPPGYGDAVSRGDDRAIQVVADGTDSNSTNVALGYARVLIGGYAEELLARRDWAARAPEPLVTAAIRVWFNPDLESRDFMIPGHRRAAAAGRHDEPVGDGDRPREGAGHARTAERHAAGTVGADRREAPAVRV